jgi:predicted Zn-dependent protease
MAFLASWRFNLFPPALILPRNSNFLVVMYSVSNFSSTVISILIPAFRKLRPSSYVCHMLLLFFGISLAASPIASGHGEYHDVVGKLEPKIKEEPSNTELRMRLLAAHVEHDESELALAEITRIEEISPGKHDLAYFRGRSLAVAGRWKEALPPLTDWLSRHPADEQALTWRARTLRETGDPTTSDADFQKACANTKNTELLTEFARSLSSRGKSGEAVTLLQDGLKRMPEDPALLDCLVQQAIAAKQPTVALEAMQRLRETWPRPEIWMKRRAEYLAQLGRNNEARAAWTELRDRILALPNLERAQPFLAEMLDASRKALGETVASPVIAPPASR